MLHEGMLLFWILQGPYTDLRLSGQGCLLVPLLSLREQRPQPLRRRARCVVSGCRRTILRTARCIMSTSTQIPPHLDCMRCRSGAALPRSANACMHVRCSAGRVDAVSSTRMSVDPANGTWQESMLVAW